MLTINASSLRASAGEVPGQASGQPAMNPAADPAGFASLLRQTQAAPTNVAPTVSGPPPSSARETANADAAPNEADSPNEANEPAPRNRALLKGKLRPAEGNGPPPRDAPAKPDNEDAARLAAIDVATERCDAPQTQAVAGETTLDPSLMHWLLGLQRPVTVAVAIDDAAPRTDTDDTSVKAGLDAAKTQRPLDPKDGADPKDKAAQATGLRDDAAGARAFASVLAAQPGSEKPAQPRLDKALHETTDAAGLGAHAPAPAPNAGTAGVAPVAVPIATPLGAPEFAQALGLRLAVLAKDGVQTAELHLNPADMGPVSVQIVMDGTQARVDFGADVAATRQAIETGLPELASALADAGFTLAGGGVSQHAGGRGNRSSADAQSSDGDRARAVAADDDTQQRLTAAARQVVARGGVDLFA